MSAPTISVRYFAGAAAAAGREQDSLAAPSAAPTLEQLLRLVSDIRPEVAEVLTRCSFLWDGVAVRDRTAPLPASPGGGTLDVLPPFAGG